MFFFENFLLFLQQNFLRMISTEILQTIDKYKSLAIAEQIDYQKFYLYSIITHSTAIEGSTVTELENQLLFDDGITANGRPLQEQMMNVDLKNAYQEAQRLAVAHADYSTKMLCRLSALVMRNTGGTYNTEEFCQWLNGERKKISSGDVIAAYCLSFSAHYRLVNIHLWADGNGRMSRLVMNMLQWEFGLIPVKVHKTQKSEYIQALNDTRDNENEEIFSQVMLDLHNRNLKAEISEFEKSMQFEINFFSK